MNKQLRALPRAGVYELRHGHGHTHREERELLGIRISYHEEAMIFSVEKEFSILYEKIQPVIRKKLEEFSVWVNENGWLVGHIKGYVTDEPRSAMVSVTENDCSVIESTDSVVKLELTSIIFLADEKKICGKINQMIEEIENV